MKNLVLLVAFGFIALATNGCTAGMYGGYSPTVTPRAAVAQPASDTVSATPVSLTDPTTPSSTAPQNAVECEERSLSCFITPDQRYEYRCEATIIRDGIAVRNRCESKLIAGTAFYELSLDDGTIVHVNRARYDGVTLGGPINFASMSADELLLAGLNDQVRVFVKIVYDERGSNCRLMYVGLTPGYGHQVRCRSQLVRTNGILTGQVGIGHIGATNEVCSAGNVCFDPNSQAVRSHLAIAQGREYRPRTTRGGGISIRTKKCSVVIGEKIRCR